MIKIWGRANSINVQKVLWACEEMQLEFERIDAGLEFGVTDTPEYRAMNPNRLIPVLQDGDFTLWESHAIVRYLARQYGGSGSLYPVDLKQAAKVDQWLDWSATTLWPAMRPVFLNMVRLTPDERNMEAVAHGVEGLKAGFTILDAKLATKKYVAGESFTLADIVMAVIAYRWYAMDIERPSLENVERWYERVTARAGFKRYCALALT